jgi:gamma-polyglutamate biosynthesis protein CapA
MSNKYLLFPLFGLIVPVLIYSFWSELKSATTLALTPIGEVVAEDVDAPSGLDDKTSDKVVFVGDVLLARHVEYLLSARGTTYPFKNVANIFGDAPAVVGNFESAILKNHIKTPSYVTTFSVAAKYLPLLAEAGFTTVSLANNHALDYGQATFNNTVEALTFASLIPFGHPQSVSSSSVTYLKSGDYTIGMIALNDVFANVSTEEIENQINDLANNSEYQIAYIHWGEEYVLKHNTRQEELAEFVIDAGIDAVIGHHPHVTQDIQMYQGKPIFYSLGNFLFDQYFSVDVQQGLAVELKLASSTVEFTLIPVSSEGTPAQPHLMPEDDRELFLKNLARRSDAGQAQNIAQGKLILPLNLATSTQTGMIAP